MSKEELMKRLLDLYQQYEAYPNSIVELYIQKLELMLIKELDKDSLYIDVDPTLEKILDSINKPRKLSFTIYDVAIFYGCGYLTEKDVNKIIEECEINTNIDVVSMIEVTKLLPISSVRAYYNKMKKSLPPECKNSIKITIEGDK